MAQVETKSDVYRCRDFYEAAYLIAKGVSLIRLEGRPRSQWIDFLFPADTRETAETFGTSLDWVRAREFAYALRDLRNRMHTFKKANR